MSATSFAVMLMGPTASGKSELAVRLAERYPFELISVDSAQVYRGMDVGTAKPAPELRARIPHRLVDIVEPYEPYSAARFRQDALREMHDIWKRRRIPLLVGGTMLYFRALLHGFSPLPPADAGVRERLTREAARDGWPALHERLARVDAVAAARIHPNDSQRIQRALEVWESSGKTMTELFDAGAGPIADYRSVRLALAPASRQMLHERIAQRFHAMLEAGLVDEVAAVMRATGDNRSLPAMRAVGYRQMAAFVAGELSFDEAVSQGIAATRQLAKRQLTWLRGESGVHWLDTDDPQLPVTAVKRLREEGLSV